jgi:hypothetical protein
VNDVPSHDQSPFQQIIIGREAVWGLLREWEKKSKKKKRRPQIPGIMGLQGNNEEVNNPAIFASASALDATAPNGKPLPQRRHRLGVHRFCIRFLHCFFLSV